MGCDLRERFALLMTDQHYLVPVHTREAGPDRAVVTERTVPVQFNELVENSFDVVE